MKQVFILLLISMYIFGVCTAASVGVEKLKDLLKPVDHKDDLQTAEQFGFGYNRGFGFGGYGGYGGYGGHGGYGGYGGYDHGGYDHFGGFGHGGSSSSEEGFFG